MADRLNPLPVRVGLGGVRMGQETMRTTLKLLLPRPVRRGLSVSRYALQLNARRCTSRSSARVLPTFLVIGAQKSGTTALYRHLQQHPGVAEPLRKEINFFCWEYPRGTGWYRAHFPRESTRRRMLDEHGAFATGDTTSNYLFHPLAARRALEVVPQAKVLAILRNPVDRAYSHYHHNRLRRRREPLERFEDALDAEERRLQGEAGKIRANADSRGRDQWHRTYLARGIYADQLPAWLEVFPREQVLVISTEQYRSQPRETYGRILRFLELPEWKHARFDTHNTNRYSEMDPRTRERLVEFFRPHNQRLYDLLGTTFDWDR